jgi:hypothetical protein
MFKIIGLIIILVFGITSFYLQYVNIEKPQIYERKDYFISLKKNTGTIKINCFDFPAVPFSTYFIYRIKETEGKILLKKDFLVCDLDYTNFNKTIDKVDIWLTSENYVEERELNFNQTKEQLNFPLTVSGSYTLEAWILESNEKGWQEILFPNIKFYVYESTESYFSEKKRYDLTLISSFLTVFGIISGFIFFLNPIKFKKRNEEIFKYSP